MGPRARGFTRSGEPPPAPPGPARPGAASPSPEARLRETSPAGGGGGFPHGPEFCEATADERIASLERRASVHPKLSWESSTRCISRRGAQLKPPFLLTAGTAGRASAPFPRAGPGSLPSPHPVSAAGVPGRVPSPGGAVPGCPRRPRSALRPNPRGRTGPPSTAPS